MRRILTAMGLLVLAACGSPAPGRAIDWTGFSSPSSVASGAVVSAAASPSLPAAKDSNLAVAAREMNSNTAAVVNGEYSIVVELERAIAGQIKAMAPSR